MALLTAVPRRNPIHIKHSFRRNSGGQSMATVSLRVAQYRRPYSNMTQKDNVFSFGMENIVRVDWLPR